MTNAPALLRISFFFFLTVFSSALLLKSFHMELGFDAAYHATVAKNLAQGYGWATSYENQFPFNPDVTTGPTLILPAALIIKLVGNEIWVPAFTAALLNLLIFLLILILYRRFFAAAQHYYICSLSLLAVYSLIEHSWWLAFTADMTVCLLAIATCLAYVEANLAEKNTSRFRYALLAGCLAGMAILAKATAGFLLVGLLLHWLIRGAMERTLNFHLLLIFLLPIVMMALPWKLIAEWKIAQLPEAQQLEIKQYEHTFFSRQGSGIYELSKSENPVVTLWQNLSRNLGVLNQHFYSRYHIPFASVGLLVLAAWSALSFRRWNSTSRRNQLITVLCLVLLANLLWFIFISYAWRAKHAMLAMMVGLFLLLYLISNSRMQRWFFAVVAMLVLIAPMHLKLYLYSLYGFSNAPSAYNRDLLRAKQVFLQQQPNTPWAGCGWVFAPWALEYLLPTAENFRDCRRLLKQGIAPGKPTLEFNLAVNKLYWQTSAYKDPYLGILKSCQANPILDLDYYGVYRCVWGKREEQTVDLGELLESDNTYFVHKPDSKY